MHIWLLFCNWKKKKASLLNGKKKKIKGMLEMHGTTTYMAKYSKIPFEFFDCHEGKNADKQLGSASVNINASPVGKILVGLCEVTVTKCINSLMSMCYLMSRCLYWTLIQQLLTRLTV